MKTIKRNNKSKANDDIYAIKNGNKPSNPNILAGFGISDVMMFRVKFLVL